MSLNKITVKKLTLSLLSLALFGLTSCEDDDQQDQPAALPSTYNFENVSYTGQENRLDMLSEIVSYVKTSNDGDYVDESQVFAMFNNQGYTWSKAELNNSTKQIANKTSEDALAMGEWISELDSISQNPGTGSNGEAGLVQSNSGTKQYLFNADGFELAQLIEKGAMGALAYYQATAVYTSDSKMDVDNESVEAGKGTAMQHHWDEAFGYWGVPKDFGSEDFTYDSNADYHRFWAKYTNAMDEHLGSNSKLMNAFIKGRDAINRKDYDTRDAAIAEVRNEWELVCAAMAIHYLNGAKAEFADDALRNHQLSEAVAFIWSLQFNPTQELTDTEINEGILGAYFTNLYEISVQDITSVKDMLAERYNLEDKKDVL